MVQTVKFGGGGSFSAYMERRRRGVASHYERKYAHGQDVHGDGVSSEDESHFEVDDNVGESDLFEGIDQDDCIESGDHPVPMVGTTTALPVDGSKKLSVTGKHVSASGLSFEGCHFYIDGVVRPYEPLLQREPCENAALHAHEKLIKLIVQHGGTIEIHLSDYVTHYVAERVALGCSRWWSLRTRGGSCRQYAVITPAYVFECYLQNRRLPEREFVPSVLKLKNGMITLTQHWRQVAKPTKTHNLDFVTDNSREGEYDDDVVSDYRIAEHINDIIDDEIVNDNVNNYDAVNFDDNDSVNVQDEPQGVKAICSSSESSKMYNNNNNTVCIEDGKPEQCHDVVTDICVDTCGTGIETDPDNTVPDALTDEAFPYKNRYREDEHPVGDSYVDEVNVVEEGGAIDNPGGETSVQAPYMNAGEHAIDKKSNNEAIETFGVEEYYKHSRLHLLGTWKSNVERNFDFEPFRPLKNGVLTNGKIIHIDMDAFFVSVALRDKPHLKSAPVAISHGSGRNSASEIATCNYEARKFGVCKGMWVKEAIRLCPSLTFVTYDFDAITETATKILRIIAGVTRRVYSASCDEHYLECFMGSDDHGMESYLSFAEELANMVESETACPLSVGIGCNMMVAKLASQKCKAIKHGLDETSNGYIRRGNVCAIIDAEAFMKYVLLRELPGVGDRAMSVLKSCGFVYCRDVQNQEELQLLLGEKMGQTVHQFCKGRDYRDMYTAEKRSKILINKTISASINYGVRVKSVDQVHEYMRQLVSQTWDRVEIVTGHIKARNTNNNSSIDVLMATIVLKLRVRSPEESIEPEKYMGCGMCDEFTASVTGDLLSQKSVVSSLITCWGKITSKMEILLEDLRGIAIAIHRIKSATGEEKNTIDRFLVNASLAPSPTVVTYPLDRENESRIPNPPALTDSGMIQPSTPKNNNSILRFFNGTSKSIKTPTKRKSHKRKRSAQCTLYDILSSSTNCSRSVNRSGDMVFSGGGATPDSERIKSNADPKQCVRKVKPGILRIVPSLSSVWLCNASNEIIEMRLNAIKKSWPMYTKVVAFYRELFANYATVLKVDVTTTTMSTSSNPMVDCGKVLYNSDSVMETGVTDLGQGGYVDGDHNVTYTCNGGGVNHHQTAGVKDHMQEVGTVECVDEVRNTGNVGPSVTLFAMRRVCKNCRTRFYKSFDISMLQDVQCSIGNCVLPRLRGLKRSEAERDCTGHAMTMVVCTLVYATLLRTIVQLEQQRRFDLLQEFLYLSMRDAMHFTAPFIGTIERPLQERFFAEAHAHLLKLYHISSSTHN